MKAPIPDWAECLRISELPAVDETIRCFAEDPTEDNAVGMVQAVLAADAKAVRSECPECGIGYRHALNCTFIGEEPIKVEDTAGYAEGWNACLQAKEIRITQLESEVVDLDRQLTITTSATLDTRKVTPGDKEMLDFLDQNNQLRMGWYIAAAPAGNLSVKSVIDGGATIRQAIRAAMSELSKDLV